VAAEASTARPAMAMPAVRATASDARRTTTGDLLSGENGTVLNYPANLKSSLGNQKPG
jgi:hypothetical protein